MRDIGVGHDHDVILRAAIGLHPFAVPGAGFENVFRDRGGPDKGNSAHFRMSEERIDTLAAAVDDIEDAFGQAGFLQ